MLMCIEVSQLSFSQVNFWFKEINTCMYSTVALRNFKKKVYNRKRTENDSLSLSECCWKENLQIKVAALIQQPKQMVELSTLSKTTLLKY